MKDHLDASGSGLTQWSNGPLPARPTSGAKSRQSDDVAEAIRSMIISFELQPGSVVSEAQLTKRLGVSRTPVREALMVLSQDFLIRQVPGMGNVVAGLDISDFGLIAECQQTIEPFATRLAALRITKAEIADLAAIVERAWSSAEEGDLDEVVRCDLAFHSAVLGGTTNHYLADAAIRMHRCTARFTRFAYGRGASAPRSIEEHERIIAALAGYLPDEAERLAYEHWANALERFRAAI